jgi:hypothetical protein
MENFNDPMLEAGSVDTSPERLRDLGLHSTELAYLVAQNPQAPSEFLNELVQKYCKGHWVQGRDYYDPDEYVLNPKYNPQILQAITANPKTPTYYLWELGKDFPQDLVRNPVFNDLGEEFKVDHSVLYNSQAEAINALLKLEQVPQWVLNRVSEISELRRNLARNESTPVHYLEILALDSDSGVRCSVASALNVLNMSVNFLENLAQDSSVEVRINLSQNTGIPASCFEILVRNTEIEVRCSVARNHNTPENCLEILAQDAEIEVRRLVAGNHNTPANCLKELAKEANEDEEIKNNIASNHNSPTDLLLEIFDHFANVKDSSSKTLCCLASNSSSPQNLLETLFLNKNKNVLYSLACNPSTPDDIMRNLIHDVDPEVSARADITFNKITNPTSLMHYAPYFV